MDAEKMAPFEWARIYLEPWPSMRWVATRLTSLACSASTCEHSWSIEGWIHSKNRNRLSQAHVERLVRTHTNMHLDDRLDDWKAAPLPWEVEMEVDDPEPEVATVDVDVPFTSLHFIALANGSAGPMSEVTRAS